MCEHIYFPINYFINKKTHVYKKPFTQGSSVSSSTIVDGLSSQTRFVYNSTGTGSFDIKIGAIKHGNKMFCF